MNPWLAGGIGFLLGRASKSCDCPQRRPYVEPIIDRLRREAAEKRAAEEARRLARAEASHRRAQAAWARAKRTRERNATRAAVEELCPPLTRRKSRRLWAYLAGGLFTLALTYGAQEGSGGEVAHSFAFIFSVITALRLFGADERERFREGERRFKALPMEERMACVRRHGWDSRCGM